MKNITVTALAVSIAVGSVGFATVVAANQRGPNLPSFEELDTNNDGVITQAEIDAIGEAKFAESDVNGDGFLDSEELQLQMQARQMERRGGGERGPKEGKGPAQDQGNAEMVQSQQAERLEMAATHMLQRADTDGDGMLSIEEARPPQAGQMFARVDADGNGEVTLEEWEVAIANRGGHGRDKT